MAKLTKNNGRILSLLADYPHKQFFTKEISDRLKISLGGTHNSLRDLAKAKMVILEQKGNMKFFRINLQNPLVRQLRVAIIIEIMSPIIQKIKKYSLKIILFGSAARGEQTAKSDIDLFILTNNISDVKAVLPQKINQMSVKAIIKNPNEWGEMEIKEPEFFLEIKQGIKLYEPEF